MTLSAFAARVRQASRPSWQLVLFGVTVTLLGCIGTTIRPDTGPAGFWLPAAGIAVAGLLVARPDHRRPVVGMLLLAGTLSSLYGGRPFHVAVVLALVNTVGAIVAVAVLAYRRAEPRAFEDQSDLLRLLAAVLLGAVTAGCAAGAAASGFLDGSFVAAGTAAAASHASGVILILPFLLRAPASGVEAGRVEHAVQWVATATVTGLVFAPGQRLPLVFLLLPVLLWPALRSNLRGTAVHLVTIAVLGAVLTFRGSGPFAVGAGSVVRSERLSIVLVQVLVITSAAVMLALLVTASQRHQLLLDISRREALFRAGFTESLLGQLLLRAEEGRLRIVELNGVATRLLDGHGEDLVGTDWGECFAPDDGERVRSAATSMVSGKAAGWHGEIVVASASQERWLEVSMSPAMEEAAAGNLLTVQMVDVTARHEAEARLAHLALSDGLTGLANRLLLDDRLEQALADTARTGRLVGVMFLDLDDFKTVNDTHGHATGDQVLVELAARLRGAVREHDTVARFGGDEFVIVFPDLADVGALGELQRRVQAAVSSPIMVAGSTRRLDASIGVTLGAAGSEAPELLRRADADMYARKAGAHDVPIAETVAIGCTLDTSPVA